MSAAFFALSALAATLARDFCRTGKILDSHYCNTQEHYFKELI